MSPFDEIVRSLRPEATNDTIDALADSWAEQFPDRAVPAEITWTVDQLREFFGPGLVDLFLEAAWAQEAYVQPRAVATHEAPVAVALRGALADVAYFRGRRERLEDVFLEVVEDTLNNPEHGRAYLEAMRRLRGDDTDGHW